MVWNSLPDDLCAQQDYESFTQGLKTWLFSRYYSVFSALETFVTIVLYKSTFTIPYHTINMFLVPQKFNIPGGANNGRNFYALCNRVIKINKVKTTYSVSKHLISLINFA